MLMLVVFLGLGFVRAQEPASEPRKEGQEPQVTAPPILNIRTAYAFLEESNVVSRLDLTGSMVVLDEWKDSLAICGSEQMDFGRTIYSDGDRLFLNQGSLAGIKVGDTFQVLGQRRDLIHPRTAASLGFLLHQKGLVKVDSVTENRAAAVVTWSASPLQEGDLLAPYREEQEILKRTVDYERVLLTGTEAGGEVVDLPVYDDATRTQAGPGDYLIVDLGRDVVQRGDFLLFRKKIRDDLPLIVCGYGSVVHPGVRGSTVRVLAGRYPVSVGDSACLIPEVEVPVAAVKGESVPTLGNSARVLPGESRHQEWSLEYPIGADSLPDDVKQGTIEEIRTFLGDASQYVVVLRGYACSIGGLESNLALSQRRAEGVRDALIAAGVKAEWIETYFYGEKDSRFDNSQESERRRNRAVLVEVNAQ